MLPDGTEVRTVTYNEEPFLQSCVERYLELAKGVGWTRSLTKAATPFITEDQSLSPQGRPCGSGPAVACPWCRHTFRPDVYKTIRDLEASVRRLSSGVAPADGTTDADKGRLQPIAAKVLMQVLYAARMARFDLLRAICHLATFVSRWSSECDRRLHRLICYIDSSYHLRMMGWVGDEPRCLSPHLFCDADFPVVLLPSGQRQACT